MNREESAYGRFEIICEKYISGTERDREIILSFLSEEEQKVFLKGCGLFHLLTDQTFYNIVRDALSEQIYKEIT